MESWERQHITQNMRTLADFTVCNGDFLLFFLEKEIFTFKVVAEIKSIPTDYDKACKFYELIQKQTNSYEALKEALKVTKQTGALDILDQVNSGNASTQYKNYGIIKYSKENLLGTGANNTKVYKGRFENKNVAVKILSLQNIDKENAEKEIKFLEKLERHANIIRYFKTEWRSEDILIAIELCNTTLQKWVTSSDSGFQNINKTEVLKQITKGMIFLHSQRVVHRDLKPENILILYPNGTQQFQVKISDFGLSKQLLAEKSKTFKASAVGGTEGWIAPEVLRQLEIARTNDTDKTIEIGLAADIFPLGCIFYFVLTGGSHPFGSSMSWQKNILKGKSELKLASVKGVRSSKAESFLWLICQMISGTDKNRPKAANILSHPAFWTERDDLDFLSKIYPHISPSSVALDKAIRLRVRDNWDFMKEMHQEIAEYLLSTQLRSKIDGGKLSHLLQIINLLKQNYYYLPPSIQQLIGGVTANDLSVIEYWQSHYPFLIVTAWTALQGFRDSIEEIKENYCDTFRFGVMTRREDKLERLWRFEMAQLPDEVYKEKSNQEPFTIGMLQNNASSSMTGLNKIKIVVVGSKEADTIGLLMEYVEMVQKSCDQVPESFDNYEIGVEFKGKALTLCLSDPPGQAEFELARLQTYKNADIVLICFSVVRHASYKVAVEKFLSEITENFPKTPYILVGTQINLREKEIGRGKWNGEKPITAKPRKSGKGTECDYMECSLNPRIGVKEVFEAAIFTVLEASNKTKKKKKGCVIL